MSFRHVGRRLLSTATEATVKPKRNMLAKYFDLPDKPVKYRDMRMKKVPADKFLGRAGMTIMWAWIFYHCMEYPEMILGHKSPPDPTLWTNEELGIPQLPEHIK
ncbi:hypothetical protein SNEBB_000162 [Seison nebaliae]|nr:hypothetical protein SNEBB_000162 [Seison nebaliae]